MGWAGSPFLAGILSGQCASLLQFVALITKMPVLNGAEVLSVPEQDPRLAPIPKSRMEYLQPEGIYR